MTDGFQRGRAASTIFHRPQTHVCVVVQGDDFAFAATESKLGKMRLRLCEWYDVGSSQRRCWREVQEFGGDAKLQGSGQVTRAKRERDVHGDGEAGTRKLELVG